MEQDTKQETPAAPVNRNKYLVSQQLQELLISHNPGQSIRFVSSQRQNTQMVLNGFLLKKKKGPTPTKNGAVIHWRCTSDSCRFTLHTIDAAIKPMRHMHNHTPPTALVLKRIAAASHL